MTPSTDLRVCSKGELESRQTTLAPSVEKGFIEEQQAHVGVSEVCPQFGRRKVRVQK